MMDRQGTEDHYMSAVDAAAMLGGQGEQQLFRAHKEGKVKLLGRRVDRNGSSALVEREPIPATYFADSARLNVQTNSIEPDGSTTDFKEFERDQIRPCWEDVRVARPEVRALKNSLVSRAGSSAAAETDCLRWLKQQMEENERPPRTKDGYRTEAKNRFQVSKRGFDRAWATASAETDRPEWRKAGAKPKNIRR